MFFKSWQVCEVVNHVGLYRSKVAEGCSAFQRRSCLVLVLQMHNRDSLDVSAPGHSP